MSRFKLHSPFSPAGDQPQAIAKLTAGVLAGEKHQTLLGVTGSGKTFAVASVIEKIQRPTLVISHNKTLAWQLYQELKGFFPENAVEYFVSYYDYYQPEAYIPQSDTYIAKDARINKHIEEMRHGALQKLLTRQDVIVVASVSCIYGLGSPETYRDVSMHLRVKEKMPRKELLKALVSLGYKRNDIDPISGNFRARGSKVDIHSASGTEIISVSIENEIIEKVTDGSTAKSAVQIFPAQLWITPEEKLPVVMANIRAELALRLEELKKNKKLLAAERLAERTAYDLEMLGTNGWTPGIENYSRHLEFRAAGEPPFTLLDYFKLAANNFLTVIDESHMTVPQLRGMYAGDRSRKETLVEHGFRLPSAKDNRPLTFKELDQRLGQRLYISATPDTYELEESGKKNVAEQLVRPTGLLDPGIEIRPTKNQMKNAVAEIEKSIAANTRVFVVTLTKRLAEDIAEYLANENIAVQYLHSDVKTLERPQILNDLRAGKYDVVVGINLLREGLDIPEVALVIIFDADKEGFLRNETTLIQTMGRAARHVEGHVIMYADTVTGSMKRAIKETGRRRTIQEIYNREHGITPKSIEKKISPLPQEILGEVSATSGMSELDSLTYTEIERAMKKAARAMDFAEAAKLRDHLKKLDAPHK